MRAARWNKAMKQMLIHDIGSPTRSWRLSAISELNTD
jgi:hypothetical protein